ncbi:hypothetical protein OIU74_024637 [Salix koriyanagi]|uniref:Uncharacterized protein n=1 Tax=Salix koriyanagi TaxID=2511006 RepID=A0A9Q1A884_9ROSI|nr:hypothetical protein OIU74_024637 [Salix koriyanagi]
MGWLPQTLACFSAVQTYQLPSEVHLSLQQLSWCRNKPQKQMLTSLQQLPDSWY